MAAPVPPDTELTRQQLQRARARMRRRVAGPHRAVPVVATSAEVTLFGARRLADGPPEDSSSPLRGHEIVIRAASPADLRRQSPAAEPSPPPMGLRCRLLQTSTPSARAPSAAVAAVGRWSPAAPSARQHGGDRPMVPKAPEQRAAPLAPAHPRGRALAPAAPVARSKDLPDRKLGTGGVPPSSAAASSAHSEDVRAGRSRHGDDRAARIRGSVPPEAPGGIAARALAAAALSFPSVSPAALAVPAGRAKPDPGSSMPPATRARCDRRPHQGRPLATRRGRSAPPRCIYGAGDVGSSVFARAGARHGHRLGRPAGLTRA